MGLPVEVNNLMLGSLGGYTVGRSLRFRASASAYLNRTPASTGSQTIWTWSGWVKRGTISASVQNVLFGGQAATPAKDNYTKLSISGNDSLVFNARATTDQFNLTTTQVFRDPCAWYHIIVAIDTTQATSTNRIKIYVNGVQVTAFATSTYPSLNYSVPYIGVTSQQNFIGRYLDVSYEYFDGYLAEVNFIDGQALTPSSFGAYDTNGVWQPKKYSGTYGTNGFYLPFSLNTTATYEGVFNGSSQSIGIPANSGFSFGSGNFTAECWVNAKSFSSFPALIDFWSNSSPSYIIGQWQLGINTAGLLTMTIATSGSALTTIQQSSGSVILNTWNHVAVVRNGTTVTLYLNGVSVGSSTFTGTVGHSTGAGGLAKQSNNTVAYLNGSLSNVRITNNAVYTAGFTPSTSPLTAISGTQLLTLQNSTLVDNSANALSLTNNGSVTFPVSYPFSTGTAISNDQSGNSNNWTPNNISLTAGTTYDSMIDSPTVSATASNYPVMNPLDKGSNLSLSNGNLQLSITAGGNDCLRCTMAIPSTGKWYWEGTLANVGSGSALGFADATTVLNSGSAFTGVGYSATNGQKFQNNWTGVTYGSTYTTNDVVGVAVDADAGTVTFYKNNVSQGVAYSSLNFATTTYFPFFFTTTTGGSWIVNFGQRPFSYTPPSGFKALNTYNLPTPTIKNGAAYMAATLYTGTGAALTVTNSQSNGGNNPLAKTFQPDFVWQKCRSAAANHFLADSVRGVNKELLSDSTIAEVTSAQYVTAFNSNGFSFGTDTGINTNAATYVAWQWLAGAGTTSTNTSGTITSTVSANPTAGFSVVTYTGNGSAGATIGHGLGIAPSMVIIKSRSGVRNWQVYHTSIGNTGAVYLNTTGATVTASTNWNNTSPTSSVVSLGTDGNVNANTETYVAYCFAAVRGYSAFGSYTGNGSADGPFIYTGFRPRYVLLKNASTAATNWIIFDTSRNTYNVSNLTLDPASSGAELTSNGWDIDILSNGFKVRNTSTSGNGSGNTIIYAAFAENPFNYSRAR